jgi:hypothetical protein
MVAIIVAYHRLIIGAALGLGEYNRVRQMTMGFAVAWSGICLSTLSSIYARWEGIPLTAPTLTAAVRFLFILAAIQQITARTSAWDCSTAETARHFGSGSCWA